MARHGEQQESGNDGPVEIEILDDASSTDTGFVCAGKGEAVEKEKFDSIEEKHADLDTATPQTTAATLPPLLVPAWRSLDLAVAPEITAGPADAVESSSHHQQHLQPDDNVNNDNIVDSPPPNGGVQAWLQVLGAFFFFFNSWGIVNTFGVYQTYYESNFLSSSSPDAISWVGSVQSFLLLAGGGVSGPLFDAGHFRALVAGGSALVVLGVFATGFATAYWHILLAQGLCAGLGMGGLVVPSLSLLQLWFDGRDGRDGSSKGKKSSGRRALATGVAVSGSSLGGVVYPLAFTALTSRVGFAWANRVLGFVALATCAVGVAAMHTPRRSSSGSTTTTTTPLQPRVVRSPVDAAAFREPAYVFYCAAMFCANLGFFVPVFYLQSYALSHGMPETDGLALNLVAVLNAASVLGRLAPALVVGRVGPINTMLAVAAMAGVVTFCWVAVEGVAGNLVFAVLFGFSSGGIVSLPAVVLAAITADLRFLGARMGTANVFNAVGSLCGPPVAGAILGSSRGSYLGLQLFAAFSIGATSVFVFGARVARVGGLRPSLLAKV